jgi:phenylalanyl-tRNA synthetase alpha chain
MSEIEQLEFFFRKSKDEISSKTDINVLNDYKLKLFGPKGEFHKYTKIIKNIPIDKKRIYGSKLNLIKKDLLQLLELQSKKNKKTDKKSCFTDLLYLPEINNGSLHIVTKAINEIVDIFQSIGFTFCQYREIEWDWYSFTGLNFPKDHPARDDFETFFIDEPASSKYGKMLLSPHTSSGQLREIERVRHKPPIRMINIAKCYRPNWDISHTPMFFQFEGLVIDKNINITNLIGTMDYFAKEFFGNERKTRLRPFHFQFTEPSFEVDINCGICLGKGITTEGKKCRYCKAGWLELGGSGMVHENVLKSGKINPDIYSGFAFGWGIERTYMMKTGTKLDDNRLLYSNDIRFLKQF